MNIAPHRSLCQAKDHCTEQLKTIQENKIKLNQLKISCDNHFSSFSMRAVASFPVIGCYIDSFAYGLGVIPMKALQQRDLSDAIFSAKLSNKRINEVYQNKMTLINECLNLYKPNILSRKNKVNHLNIPEKDIKEINEFIGTPFIQARNNLIDEIEKKPDTNDLKYQNLSNSDPIEKFNSLVDVINKNLPANDNQENIKLCKITPLEDKPSVSEIDQHVQLVVFQSKLKEFNKEITNSLIRLHQQKEKCRDKPGELEGLVNRMFARDLQDLGNINIAEPLPTFFRVDVSQPDI